MTCRANCRTAGRTDRTTARAREEQRRSVASVRVRQPPRIRSSISPCGKIWLGRPRPRPEKRGPNERRTGVPAAADAAAAGGLQIITLLRRSAPRSFLPSFGVSPSVLDELIMQHKMPNRKPKRRRGSCDICVKTKKARPPKLEIAEQIGRAIMKSVDFMATVLDSLKI